MRMAGTMKSSFWVLIGILTVELLAKDSTIVYADLSRNSLPASYRGTLFARERISTGEAITFAVSKTSPPAASPVSLFAEGNPINVDYHLQGYQGGNFSTDSSMAMRQVLAPDDPVDFSGEPPIPQYYLTSTNISRFFSHSAYGQKFLRGTRLWVGVGVGMMGVLMLAPRSVTRWENDYARQAVRNLSESFSSPPVWDQDHWPINYVGHPYAGSIYYNTLRCQDATVLQSFIFSAFISTGWEYLYEGVAERPSIQDLVVTPMVGSILGELTHQATVGMKKNGCNLLEKTFIIILNPVHVIFRGFH